ncbi:MAG TPA: glycosyltransferase family 1 protein [Halieaceae bacterium]|nr:glycosyltransferase family 1 protein [Halieaceae bacterium]
MTKPVKKVVINGRFLSQKMTGVQRYALELTLELQKLHPDWVVVSPNSAKGAASAQSLNVKFAGCLKGHLWEQLVLPLVAKRLGADLVLNFCNTGPLFASNLLVLHDVSFKRHPLNFSRSFRIFYSLLIPLLLRSVKQLVTDSDFSRDEICDVYPIQRDDVEVIYCAPSPIFIDKGLARSPFILAVSSVNKLKNFDRLMDAFVAAELYQYELKIVGDNHGSFNSDNYSSHLPEQPRVKFLGRVSDEDLVDLYNTATLFVFPSLYEGFGIPPLEAQACGCVCLVSNAASLPEVCGTSAAYFNPEDTLSLTKSIRELLADESVLQDYKLKGFQNIDKFSWGESAARMSRVVEEVLYESGVCS